jgi:antitoxin CcdA
MTELFDINAPKKSANLSINSDLLDKAKALKVNLSSTLEVALKEKLAANNAENWAKRNERAIKVYNDFVEEHGYFGEEYREF